MVKCFVEFSSKNILPKKLIYVLDIVDTEFFKFISHTLNCHNTLFVTIVCSGVATIQFQIETVSLLLDAPEVIGDVCEVLWEISIFVTFLQLL